MWHRLLKKAAVPGIVALVALGFQLSGFRDIRVATGLWILAGHLLLVFFLPIRRWIRFQTPIVIVSREAKRDQGAEKSKPIISTYHQRLEHDGVLWEDTGSGRLVNGHVTTNGPLCPEDYCPLSLRYPDGREEARADSHIDAIISDGYHALFCLQCGATYNLGTKPKTLRQSREEVATLFGGLRGKKADT
jgi:hypothetical protein